MNELKQKLISLFENYFGEKVIKISLIPQSGSYRKYFRIQSEKRSVIGTFNEDLKENQAFFHFTENFLNKNFNVPKIYVIDKSQKFYLQEDLGDISLFSVLKKKESNEIIIIYNKVLDWLVKFQTQGLKGLDLSKCYPRQSFDYQSVIWDLNYFKYMVLKVNKVPFDEQLLENDFQKLAYDLQKADINFFMYRDFQSANILLKDNEPYFVDYQGGRRGAIFYDLASLLFDAKANLSSNIREILKENYFEKITKFIKFNKEEFDALFYKFVLIRVLQAFAAYSFRGQIEKKTRFLLSIPLGIKNLKFLFEKDVLNPYDELKKSIEFLTQEAFEFSEYQEITVEINSFSYRDYGYPEDKINYGGFVFDCRLLPNPGRIDEYKNLTGLDLPVKNFLDAQPEAEEFLANVFNIILKTLKLYSEKGYDRVQINFGCTGGRHRSVYCAEKIARMLKDTVSPNIILNHLSLNRLGFA